MPSYRDIVEKVAVHSTQSLQSETSMKKNLDQDPTKNQHSHEAPSSETVKASEAFAVLLKIVADLRGPRGCPWDKEQTHSSLTQYAIEEAYELAEAIENGTAQDIKEELGDFLFQVVLNAQVAHDDDAFSIVDVITTLNKKMIHRHPHVFGKTEEKTIKEVWLHWDQLKAQEQSKPKPVFSYPRNMPALQAAHKIGVKTEGYKFDWSNSGQVFEKLREEFHELEEALATTQTDKIEEELGDLLFSAAQLARHLKLEPEQVLRKANRKFEDRFNEVLKISGLNKQSFRELSPEKMEEFWKLAKIHLKKQT